jgi:hypothetical protein
MKHPNRLFYIAILVLFGLPLTSLAQKSKVKYGDVQAKEFATQATHLDSNAHAIVLFDIGSSSFESNGDDFTQVYQRHCRILILHKDGFNHATIKIPVYAPGKNEDRVTGLKAHTYNLVNGKVVEKSLKSSDVFTDRLSDTRKETKFTFPDVQEGSIIEYTYKIQSRYAYDISSWTFQNVIPTLHSSYTVDLPEYYDYMTLTQGHMKAKEIKRDVMQRTYTLSEEGEATRMQGAMTRNRFTISPNVARIRYVYEDIKPLKLDAYVTSLGNHIQMISFQLNSVKYPNQPARPHMSTWPQAMKGLLDQENFGHYFKRPNNFLDAIVQEIIKGKNKPEDKAHALYEYVRDEYVATTDYGFYTKQSIRETIQTKKGNAAEINLLLVALLKKAGLDAEPILLSTRDHIKPYELYPIMERFNYVIAVVKFPESAYFLDATVPYLGFSKLPAVAFNGHVREVSEQAIGLSLDAELLQEKSHISCMYSLNEEGHLVGQVQLIPGYYASLRYRTQIKNNGIDSFKEFLQSNMNNSAQISDIQVDSLNRYEQGLVVRFKFLIEQDDEDLLVLDPLLGFQFESNPFQYAERYYPVELPYRMEDVYSVTISLPEGYAFDEFAKPVGSKLYEDAGRITYITQQSGNTLQIQCRFHLNTVEFAIEQYADLKAFFDDVVRIQNLPVVLKKVK